MTKSGERTRSPAKSKRLLRISATLLLLAPLGTAGLLVLIWLERRTSLTLPAPTGRLAVGRAIYEWTNDAQRDELSPIPGAKREVVAWIWYPAARSPSAKPADYLPAPWRTALARASHGNWVARVNDFLERDSSRVQVHSYSEPDASPEERKYPVIIMRAGLGAPTTDYTTLAEDLASYGYLVVGFDAPYRTGLTVFPDGRVVARPPQYNPENLSDADAERLANKLLRMWVSDAQFVADRLERLNSADPSGRFTRRLDIERLGFFGHSFGGAQALQFCHDDRRCKAGIDLDGAPFGSVVKEGLPQPFMFLLSDHGRADLGSLAERRTVGADIASIYDRLTNGRSLLMIRGANHFTFSDLMLRKSQYIVRPLLLLTRGPSPIRGLAISRVYVHTFFDVYLKNAPESLLDNLPRFYPEVVPLRLDR